MNLIQATVLLFLIMDPVGNLPIFNSILKNRPAHESVKIIIRELVFAYLLLIGFLILGDYVQSYLSLRVSTLHIAGGIILLLVALGMVFPGIGMKMVDGNEEPFFVPLAMPLVAGPAAIAIVLILGSSQPANTITWVIALSISWSLAALILVPSPWVFKFIGEKAARILERLMGMILIMLAVQMFLNGVELYVGTNF
ncbi:MAG: NAAT family transporter [Gammaproteobacteria bacterium]|nr:NAAT family transporter [Gammaproteobacteria bacterium]NNC66707.1 NAAT family transporter [Gammaproteobacteria bacterium]